MARRSPRGRTRRAGGWPACRRTCRLRARVPAGMVGRVWARPRGAGRHGRARRHARRVARACVCRRGRRTGASHLKSGGGQRAKQGQGVGAHRQRAPAAHAGGLDGGLRRRRQSGKQRRRGGRAAVRQAATAAAGALAPAADAAAAALTSVVGATNSDMYGRTTSSAVRTPPARMKRRQQPWCAALCGAAVGDAGGGG